MTKRQITDSPEDRQDPPFDDFDTQAPFAERLRRVRADLRRSKLTEMFQLQREIEAFSIHPLAGAVEDILNRHGLISSWTTKRWSAAGNRTILEGTYWINAVDTDDKQSWDAVGEGVDNGDKGCAKALSGARKNAMIGAFNLGVGLNNETDQTPASPEAQAPMGGAMPMGDPGRDGLTLTLKGTPVVVPTIHVCKFVTDHLDCCVTGLDVNEYVEANREVFRWVWQQDASIGQEIFRLVNVRHDALAAKVAA